jgi:hypothetical protein
VERLSADRPPVADLRRLYLEVDIVAVPPGALPRWGVPIVREFVVVGRDLEVRPRKIPLRDFVNVSVTPWLLPNTNRRPAQHRPLFSACLDELLGRSVQAALEVTTL